MKIVITDGYTLNPGDLSWRKFRDFGTVSYYDRTGVDEVIDRCRDAEVIITNKTLIGKKVMDECSRLKMIAVTATGYNVVDIKTAVERNILVCNVPEYGTASVAQHTIALLLELTNHVGINSQSVKEGGWSSSIDWSYSKAPIIELMDKVLGIVGLGRIGNQTALIAAALGMKVIYHRGSARSVIARQVSLKELFSDSDFISLHCPVTADNTQFVNADLLSGMKPTAFLINTSRGQLIHEQDLADALRNGVLAGAALDVLSKEPPPPDHPLVAMPNCLITPHNAWLSIEARKRILETTFENIRLAFSGSPQNVVNQ